MAGRARWVPLALLACAATARADSPARPVTYTVGSPNGKFVFVLLVNSSPQEDERWTDEVRADIRRLRATYPQSGMYRNDGSNRPLWTVDWYAHNVEIADDGVHLIRHGPWPTLPSGTSPPRRRHLERDAVSFYANGVLIRTYQIGELVTVPSRLPRTVSHFQWRAESEFDRERMQFHVRTHDGGRFTFDVRTGEMLSANPAESNFRFVWPVVAACAVAALVAWLIGRRRARALRPE